MTPPPDLLWDGPASSPRTVLLAHGAGAGRSSPFLAEVARGLAAHGLRVARFDFPYMAARATGERRAPDRAPVLLDCFRAAAAATGSPPAQLVLAGKSLGGRMATMLADELGANAIVVFGYPFHPPEAKDQLRVAHLQALCTRCLILQGERDPFGTKEQVAGYALSPTITLQWLADGDHSLAPRVRSGFTRAAHLSTAIAAAAAFALA